MKLYLSNNCKDSDMLIAMIMLLVYEKVDYEIVIKKDNCPCAYDKPNLKKESLVGAGLYGLMLYFLDNDLSLNSTNNKWKKNRKNI